jgi:hypothetical protein
VRSGNDASDFYIATSNCSYCAVGGLVGASASAVMADVYAMVGAAVPKGGLGGDDGAGGFARLYERRVSPGKLTSKNMQEFQIEGVTYYLKLKGCTVTAHGSAAHLLRTPALKKAANALPEGSLFLCFTGEDIAGVGAVTVGAHWTVGQVQGGEAVFYDYQMKVSGMDASWKSILVERTETKTTLSETGTSTDPVAAWGVELDDDDGLGLLLEVSKAAKKAS